MTVYLIQCQQTYNVKIGYTSRLVQTRLAELRTAASTPIELVKWYPKYSEADEQALHEIFARYRVTGEWFKSDVLTLIDHEIEMMGMIGDRDYEAKAPNGAEITPAVMTVNVAVLKIGTQNMKQSFFEQLPVEEGFTCEYKINNCDITNVQNIEIKPGRLWGVVDIPIKKYGNVTGIQKYWLFENQHQLVRRYFDRFFNEDINIGFACKKAPNYAEVRAMLDNAQQLFLV